MVRLYLAIIILSIFILGYAIEDAISDVTSNGATTNSQTNASGSNTAISGGYSQETTNNYTGGQTNTTTNSTSNSTNQETAVNSATSGLHIACLALELKKNDYLWTVPNTFVSSANCGRFCGAKIDFVDINSETLNICEKELSKKLIQAKKQKKLPNQKKHLKKN